MKYLVTIIEAWAGAEEAAELSTETFNSSSQVKQYLKELSQKYKTGVIDLTINGPDLRRELLVQIDEGEINLVDESLPITSLLQQKAATNPRLYYHVTTEENLPGIRQKGLLGKGAGKGEHLLRVAKSPLDQPENIYLFKHSSDARSYASDVEDPVILKVRVRQTLYPDPEMHYAEGDIVFVKNPIPPEDIKGL